MSPAQPDREGEFPGGIHPVNRLFPMLPPDEMEDFVEDVRQHGLLSPIVVDANGVLLDGKIRWAACQKTGIEPRFTTFNGEDQHGYILSVNLLRANMNRSQKAMGAALLGLPHRRSEEIAFIRAHAPEMVSGILKGYIHLDTAIEEARQRRQEIQTRAALFVQLQAADPDLAERVTLGELTLSTAQEELIRKKKRREAEAWTTCLLSRDGPV